MTDYEDISKLIAAEILGKELDEEQRRRLEAWKAEPGHAELYAQIASLQEADQVAALHNTGYGELSARAWRGRVHRTRRLVARWTVSVVAAAACVAAVVLGIDFLQMPHQAIAPVDVPTLTAQASRTVTLRLSDGREMAVDPERGLTPEMSAMIQEAEWAQIDVARGTDMDITLHDGTRAWLGAESSMRIPSRFDGERRVAVSGEVCLDVAHDAEHPFTVATSRGDVRVLGTRFNISDYPGKPLSVTLERGSVQFTAKDGRKRLMKPDQTLTYDERNGALDIKEGSGSAATSWTVDEFVFTDEPLEAIMQTLGRWYDFEPEFADASLGKMRFSGRLDRRQNVEVLLDAFSATEDVRFLKEGHTIRVTK